MSHTQVWYVVLSTILYDVPFFQACYSYTKFYYHVLPLLSKYSWHIYCWPIDNWLTFFSETSTVYCFSYNSNLLLMCNAIINLKEKKWDKVKKLQITTNVYFLKRIAYTMPSCSNQFVVLFTAIMQNKHLWYSTKSLHFATELIYNGGSPFDIISRATARIRSCDLERLSCYLLR